MSITKPSDAPPDALSDAGSMGGKKPIRFRTTLRNTILDVCIDRGWIETPNVNPASETDWDFFWADKAWMRDQANLVHLSPGQKMNHFRNYYELTRKDLLVKNLKREKRARAKAAAQQGDVVPATPPHPLSVGDALDFYPETYSLPAEYLMFVDHFQRTPGSVWIMKPVGSAQGKGIFLVDKLSQVNEWKVDSRWQQPKEDEKETVEKYIIQQYLHKPLLIGGRKFDMRIYALVVNYNPLEVWLYREGFARFTSCRYSSDMSNMENSFMHLTNVAIQKTGATYDASTGGKWDLHSLRMHLNQLHGTEKVDVMFDRIRQIIIQSLLSVQKSIICDNNSFEMYGFDVLFDEDLKPWIIEVNACPSLTANTKADYHLKYTLVQDTLNVVDMEKERDGTETQMGGYDLIYKDGYATPPPRPRLPCMLGCWNDREKNLNNQIERKRVKGLIKSLKKGKKQSKK